MSKIIMGQTITPDLDWLSQIFEVGGGTAQLRIRNDRLYLILEDDKRQNTINITEIAKQIKN
jgi:hypothetical protein